MKTVPHLGTAAKAVGLGILAAALLAGVAYALTDRAKLDIGFRYMNLGQYQPLPGSTAAGVGTVSVKEVKVGVRYMID